MKISGFVEYVKQIWKNKPDTSTPVSAERLNHIEEGIKANSDALAALAAVVCDQVLNDPEKIASLAALYSVDKKIGNTANLPNSAVDVVTALTTLNSNLTYSYNEVVHNGVTWYVHTLRLKDIQIISATGAISCEGCSNVWGSIYASDTIYANFTYPNPFAELPSIHLNFVPSGANAWPMMTLDGSKTNGPNVQLIRGTTYSAFSGRLSMLMIGRAG